MDLAGSEPDRPESIGGSPLSTEEIIRLVYDRERSRLSKDFEQADLIRESLHAGGVSLFDNTHHWRTTDGRSGHVPTWAELEVASNGDVPNTRFGDSIAPRVKELVQQREEARSRKDFAHSDALRAELKTLGVEIFDKEKMWRGRDGLSGVIIGYRGPGSTPTDIEITTLVAHRERARQNHDWETSDMIRDELKAHGVHIIDREKKWTSSDGRAGPTRQVVPGTVMDAFAFAGSLQHAASLAGMTQQQQILAVALAATQGHGQGAAMVGARGLQLATLPHPGLMRVHAPAPLSAALKTAIVLCTSASTPLTDEEIGQLIDVRERARKLRDWHGADRLRDAMRARGLEVNQNQKVWTTRDGRQGIVPAWSELAES